MFRSWKNYAYLAVPYALVVAIASLVVGLQRPPEEVALVAATPVVLAVAFFYLVLALIRIPEQQSSEPPPNPLEGRSTAYQWRLVALVGLGFMVVCALAMVPVFFVSALIYWMLDIEWGVRPAAGIATILLVFVTIAFFATKGTVAVIKRASAGEQDVPEGILTFVIAGLRLLLLRA